MNLFWCRLTFAWRVEGLRGIVRMLREFYLLFIIIALALLMAGCEEHKVQKINDTCGGFQFCVASTPPLPPPSRGRRAQ